MSAEFKIVIATEETEAPTGAVPAESAPIAPPAPRSAAEPPARDSAPRDSARESPTVRAFADLAAKEEHAKEEKHVDHARETQAVLTEHAKSVAAPAKPTAEPEAKEQWQMTRDDHRRYAEPDGAGGFRVGDGDDAERFTKREDADEFLDEQHRGWVEHALKEHRAVPPEVAAEYPDLMAKYPPVRLPPPIPGETPAAKGQKPPAPVQLPTPLPAQSPDLPQQKTPAPVQLPAPLPATTPSPIRMPAPIPAQAATQKLSAEEQGAVDAYAGSDAYRINDHLRGTVSDRPDPNGDRAWALEEAKKNIPHIDAAIEKASSKKDQTVYRGLSWSGNPEEDFKKGSTHIDPGFSSTTKSREVADRFASSEEGLGHHRVVMEIALPKGSNALAVNPKRRDLKSRREQEILLGRNSEYDIQDVTKVGDTYVVKASYKKAAQAPPADPTPEPSPVDRGDTSLPQARDVSHDDVDISSLFEPEPVAPAGLAQHYSDSWVAPGNRDEMQGAILGYSNNKRTAANSGFSAQRMNKRVRGGAQDENADTLDRVLSTATTPQDLTAYRGIDHRGLAALGNTDVGSVISDQAFMSTSLDPDYARIYTQPDMSEPSPGVPAGALMHLEVPKGSNAAYLEGAQAELGGESVGEHELLFNRNQQMEVTRKHTDEQGLTHIHARILQAKAEAAADAAPAPEPTQQPEPPPSPVEHWGNKEEQPYYRPGANPTVDNVITRDGEDGKEVLLIQRKKGTVEGEKWALPGGFHDTDAKKGEPWKEGRESAQDAAMRELAEETGLDAKVLQPHMKHVGEYEGGGRDPRDNEEAWSKSSAFSLHLPPELASKAVAGQDDAQDAQWVPLSKAKDLPMAFDHGAILADAVEAEPAPPPEPAPAPPAPPPDPPRTPSQKRAAKMLRRREEKKQLDLDMREQSPEYNAEREAQEATQARAKQRRDERNAIAEAGPQPIDPAKDAEKPPRDWIKRLVEGNESGNAHVLIEGESGSGKSSLTKKLAFERMKQGQDVHVVDTHTPEAWGGAKQVFQGKDAGAESAVFMRQELESRKAESYRAKTAGEQPNLKQMTVVFSDFARIMKDSPELQKEFRTILTEARKFKMSVIADTTRFTGAESGLKGIENVRANFGQKVQLFAPGAKGEPRTAKMGDEAFPLPEMGDFAEHRDVGLIKPEREDTAQEVLQRRAEMQLEKEAADATQEKVTEQLRRSTSPEYKAQAEADEARKARAAERRASADAGPEPFDADKEAAAKLAVIKQKDAVEQSMRGQDENYKAAAELTDAYKENAVALRELTEQARIERLALANMSPEERVEHLAGKEAERVTEAKAVKARAKELLGEEEAAPKAFDPYADAAKKREKDVQREQVKAAYDERYGDAKNQPKSAMDAGLDMAQEMRGTLGGAFGRLPGAVLDVVAAVRKSRPKDKSALRKEAEQRNAALDAMKPEQAAEPEPEAAAAAPAEAAPEPTAAEHGPPKMPELPSAAQNPQSAAGAPPTPPANVPKANASSAQPAAGGGGGPPKPPTPPAGAAAGAGGEAAAGAEAGGLAAGAAAMAGPAAVVVAAVVALQALRDGAMGAVRGIGDTTASLASFKDGSARVHELGDSMKSVSEKLFYVSPALGMLGSVAGETVSSVAKLDDAVKASADRLAQYSGELAAQKAQQDVAVIMRDINRARTMGSAVANANASRFNMEQKLQDITDKFVPYIMKIADEIFKVLNGLFTVIDGAMTLLGPAVDAVAPIATAAAKVAAFASPIATIVGLLRDIGDRDRAAAIDAGFTMFLNASNPFLTAVPIPMAPAPAPAIVAPF